MMKFDGRGNLVSLTRDQTSSMDRIIKTDVVYYELKNKRVAIQI